MTEPTQRNDPPAIPPTIPLAPSRAAGAMPDRLGPFRIVGQLGEGGMGTVLEVADDELGRRLAAKIIRGEATPHQRAKFATEARVTGQLEHPGIVPLHAFGQTHDGRRYFVMKRVQGDELGPATTTMDLPRKLAVFLKVCEAIAFAHARGVIHRDLKPANVMVGEYGEVLVMDWGLAKVRGEQVQTESSSDVRDIDDAPMATADGTVLGTPSYMSPEQARGEAATLDERADIYSLGAILYELLTGEPPYSGGTVWEVLGQVTDGALVPPRRRAPERDIPRELEAICLKAMARDAGARYPSAERLAADVEAYLGGRLVGAASYRPTEVALKWIGRHKAIVAVLSAIAMTLVAAAIQRQLAQRSAVQQARANVAGLDPAARYAAAEAALKMPDRGPRSQPLADQLSSLRALDEAQAALQRLVPSAGRDRVRTLELLGRLAVAREELGLAESFYRSIAPLRAARARALLRRLDGVRAQRLDRQKRAIAEALAEAEAGKLRGELAYRRAVIQLASFRERQTVDLLLARVEDTTRRIARTWRESLLAFAASGDEDLPAERRALIEQWCRWRQAATADGPLPEDPTDANRRWVRRLLERYEHAAAARIRRRGKNPELIERWTVVLARAQLAALNKNGDRARANQLACEVLGLLGDTRAIPALERNLRAALRPKLALPPALALANLSERDPRAERALTTIVGRRPDPRGAVFSVVKSFWLQVSRHMALAGGAADDDDVDDLLRRGMLLQERGLHEQAVAIFDRVIATNPDLPTAYNHRGGSYVKLRQKDKARADFDRAIALDPDEVSALVSRAILRFGERQYTQALEDASRAVELAPQHPLARYWRSVIRRESGDARGARADVDALLLLHPDNVQGLMMRGILRSQSGDEKGGMADLERALQLDPTKVEIYQHRGTLHARRGRLDEALADYDRAVSMAPNNPHIYVVRARLLRRIGRLTGAFDDVRRALTIDPQRGEAHVVLTQLRLDKDQPRKALAAADRAVALTPTGEAYLWRGVARGRTGDVEGALEDFGRAVTRVSVGQRAEIHHRRGQLLSAKRRWPEALAALDSALAGNPHPRRLHDRAVVRRALRDDAGALVDLDAAVKLAPEQARYVFRRGILHFDNNRLKLALADFDRAIALDPDNAGCFRNRAATHHRMGNKAAALKDIRQAIALKADIADYHFLMAMILRDLKRSAPALAAIERSLTLDRRVDQRWVLAGELLSNLERDSEALARFDAFARVNPRHWLIHVKRALSLSRLGRKPEAIAAIDRAIPLAPAERRAGLEDLRKRLGA